MKTLKSILTLAAALLAACEGNTWPAPSSGLDASASHSAMPSTFAVDVSPSTTSSHPAATAAPARVAEPIDASLPPAAPDAVAAVDAEPVAAPDAVANATPDAAAQGNVVLLPVVVPILVPDNLGAPVVVAPPPASSVAGPPLFTPPSAAPAGTGGTLGQYGTQGAYSSTGVTAGDPGMLRGNAP